MVTDKRPWAGRGEGYPGLPIPLARPRPRPTDSDTPWPTASDTAWPTTSDMAWATASDTPLIVSPSLSVASLTLLPLPSALRVSWRATASEAATGKGVLSEFEKEC
jgi:hypothetical protein